MLKYKDRPYNSLPLLPPDSSKWETLDVYKKLAVARSALAELKGRAPVIPNPMMLMNTIVVQEAKDSSSIENILTTSDNLYMAMASPSIRQDSSTKEVLKYREAIWSSYQQLKKSKRPDNNLIIDIFRTITGSSEGIRNVQVRIGNASTTVYTPPECGKTLENKLKNWFKFAVTDNGIDPLIKMAILHHQFESIHPFTDGNGRTGRIFNVLFLTWTGLLELPVLYLSKYILKNKQEYYRLLNVVRETDNWEEWILYMLEAVIQTSTFTLEKVNAVFSLFHKVQVQLKSQASDIYSYELLETLFSQPYCKIGILVEKGIASRNTASKYLKRLSDLQILVPVKKGSEFMFLNKNLYDILSKG